MIKSYEILFNGKEYIIKNCSDDCYTFSDENITGVFFKRGLLMYQSFFYDSFSERLKNYIVLATVSSDCLTRKELKLKHPELFL